MLSRAARLALLAVFLVGTFSGPLLALCLPGAEAASCCCTKERQCPRPKSAEAWARGCCKTSPPTAPATSGPSERSVVEPALGAVTIVVSTTPSSHVTPTPNSGDATARRVDGVGLYTVHEAFLI